MRRVALVMSLVLLAGCGGEGGSATVEWYRVDSAGTTLTLDVLARPGSTVRAEVLAEDSDAVVVKVRAVQPAGEDLGVHYPVTVTLEEPLGGRAVRTDDGVGVVPSPP